MSQEPERQYDIQQVMTVEQLERLLSETRPEEKDTIETMTWKFTIVKRSDETARQARMRTVMHVAGLICQYISRPCKLLGVGVIVEGEEGTAVARYRLQEKEDEDG